MERQHILLLSLEVLQILQYKEYFLNEILKNPFIDFSVSNFV